LRCVTLLQAFGSECHPIKKGAARKEIHVLHYAVVFLVIALVAALFGFGGIAAGAVEIAKILFFVFVILAIASFIVGLVRRR
jgi:uncharacterized membrane protein YtjA (UPF0391 family)